MNPHVTRLTQQAEHRLLLEFDNGEKRLFDLTPWLDKGVFRALRDSPESRKPASSTVRSNGRARSI